MRKNLAVLVTIVAVSLTLSAAPSEGLRRDPDEPIARRIAHFILKLVHHISDDLTVPKP